MNKMKLCPFCKPERVLAENEWAYVLASDPRLTFGHLLVVPKRHVEKPWLVRDDEMMAIWKLVRKYQKKLVERVGDGCDVRENYRPFLRQSNLKVDHVHWHLIPRTHEDEIYMSTQIGEKAVFRAMKAGEIEELAKML